MCASACVRDAHSGRQRAGFAAGCGATPPPLLAAAHAFAFTAKIMDKIAGEQTARATLSLRLAVRIGGSGLAVRCGLTVGGLAVAAHGRALLDDDDGVALGLDAAKAAPAKDAEDEAEDEADVPLAALDERGR